MPYFIYSKRDQSEPDIKDLTQGLIKFSGHRERNLIAKKIRIQKIIIVTQSDKVPLNIRLPFQIWRIFLSNLPNSNSLDLFWGLRA
jgi:hypothetical protein